MVLFQLPLNFTLLRVYEVNKYICEGLIVKHFCSTEFYVLAKKHVYYIQTIIHGASNSFSYIKMLIFVPLNSMFWQNIIISKQLFMVEANSFSYIKMLSSLKKYISLI